MRVPLVVGYVGDAATHLADDDDSPSAAFCSLDDSPCDAEDSCAATLQHHIFDDTTQSWRRQASQPQPSIELQLSLQPTDYDDLGVKCTVRPTTITQKVIADTGCQSCLAGTALMRRLAVTEADLVPTSMRMHAANGDPIDIPGAVILRISGHRNGSRQESRQFVYITPTTDTMYLSRDACRDLGMIDAAFPAVGLASVSADGINVDEYSPCSCPRRQTPPPKPTKLPMPATEENADALRRWLVDYFSASTFNTCEHQPLTTMDGPPLRLMIQPDAEPVAHHKAIPVPLHWQTEVKAALDRDVQLGVIEPVPVGEPVTWCHRMVVVSKKSGSPRRCVDLQPHTFTLPLLYKTLVRPHIEYGNLVWGPFNRADQKLVERVQRRATRLVSSIRHLPYEERLRRLRLPSLYYRRKRGDMIFMYQLFNGGVDVNPEDFFSLVKGGTTRGHPFKVQKPRAECRVRRSAFSVRVVNSWNALPAHVVCSSSLTSFKKHLDAHWAHIWYDTPDT